MKCCLVLPSLKVTGGTLEILRLQDLLERRGVVSIAVSMWDTPHPVVSGRPVHLLSSWRSNARRAFIEMPLLWNRFRTWVRNGGDARTRNDWRFIFSHYSTLPLALVVPSKQRLFFVQDLEWKFIESTCLSAILQRIILFFYRRGKIISTNGYLTRCLQDLKLNVALELPVWADARFLTNEGSDREYDFVMVLRKGYHKRLDMYLAFIEMANSVGGIRIAVISQEDDIAALVRDRVAMCLVRPQIEDMRRLYLNCKCFIHLSDHEGFGLPPLEAMGAGCIPLCRDSGGVRAFMAGGDFSQLLLAPETNLVELFGRAMALLASSAELERLSDAARTTFTAGLAKIDDRGAALDQILSERAT